MIRFSILFFIAIFGSEYCISQHTQNYCDLFKKTLQSYNENSLTPIKPEKFDMIKFERDFLASIDPNAIIFSADDLKLFDAVQQVIQNDYTSSYCTIEADFRDIYKRNCESTIQILERLSTQRFELNKPDSICVNPESLQNTYEMDKMNRCRVFIKSIIIQKVLESTTQYDSLKENPDLLLAYIDSIKVKRIQKEISQIKKLLSHPDEYHEKLFSAFMNNFMTQYDPYAYLFSSNAYNKFKEALSSNSSYFGFQIEMNKLGDIIIASVIPGSNAWKTGMINSGDIIVKFETENKASIIIEENEISEVIDFLSNITNEKLIVTLLKADKKTVKVDLYREKLENVENSVQAFILQGKHKIGYIILPAFYTSWESQNQFGCAQDVGRAIYFLKKENIESLIIDLRNNSGGSIGEAIDLAGIFIDFGTLSVERSKNNELVSIKDFNRGTLYADPLAILVNSNSASASEMVAAVLQDYNRAVIIGDTTYGKATGQILQPIMENDETVLKLTTSKYYRVTGHTYDTEGVIPDVVLPDYFYQSDFKNMSLRKNRMDTINRKTFYNPLPSFPKDSLQLKSRERISHNNKYQSLRSIDHIYSDLFLQKKYLPLDFKHYYKIIQQKEVLDQKIVAYIDLKTDFFTVQLLPKEEGMAKMNKFYADLYNESTNAILADPYIEETFRILIDYIHIKKN